jgi:hypothetical protein
VYPNRKLQDRRRVHGYINHGHQRETLLTSWRDVVAVGTPTVIKVFSFSICFFFSLIILASPSRAFLFSSDIRRLYQWPQPSRQWRVRTFMLIENAGKERPFHIRLFSFPIWANSDPANILGSGDHITQRTDGPFVSPFPHTSPCPFPLRFPPPPLSLTTSNASFSLCLSSPFYWSFLRLVRGYRLQGTHIPSTRILRRLPPSPPSPEHSDLTPRRKRSFRICFLSSVGILFEIQIPPSERHI